MPDQDNNGWVSWSKHVLKELERLNEGQDQIKHDIQEVKTAMSRVAVLEDQIRSVKEWKKNVGEVYSPTQLAEHKKDVEQLKIFKTKSITAFAVIQTLFGVIYTLALAYFEMG